MVGEKAKGSVEIRNNTSELIKLPVGTILTSSTDLKFVTVKSASISGSLLAGTYGKESVEVEAGSIGSEYNYQKTKSLKLVIIQRVKLQLLHQMYLQVDQAGKYLLLVKKTGSHY